MPIVTLWRPGSSTAPSNKSWIVGGNKRRNRRCLSLKICLVSFTTSPTNLLSRKRRQSLMPSAPHLHAPHAAPGAGEQGGGKQRQHDRLIPQLAPAGAPEQGIAANLDVIARRDSETGQGKRKGDVVDRVDEAGQKQGREKPAAGGCLNGDRLRPAQHPRQQTEGDGAGHVYQGRYRQ